ncbi:MAG: methyltransferase domain-containing protein [Cyclobacteriaceae bacterium]
MAAPQLNRFDKIAPFYDKLAGFAFGNSLMSAQEYNLDTIAEGADVLVIGGGTGKFLTQLLVKNKSCRIWFVEASEKMIELAKKNLNFTNRVIYMHGTHENGPDRNFDIVITHFFVDMFTDLELHNVMQIIHGHLKSQGRWLVADFVNHKYWHRIFLKVMYIFFNCLGALDIRSLSNWDRIIQSGYFKKIDASSFYGGFINSVSYKKT